MGIPPDHLQCGQVDVAAAGRYQRFAFVTAADQAPVVVLVAQLRLVRVAPQAIDLGGGQGRQLRAGQAFGLEGQGAGQRVTDPALCRVRVPAFAQAEAASRQPGGVGRIVGGLGLDGQQQFAGADPGLLAHFGRAGGLAGIALCRRGAEHLRGNHQRAALLRVNGIAHFNHAMTHAIDELFIGARFAQLFDARVGNLQWREAAVVVQRYRMVNAQGQDGLGLHVHSVFVQAGFDEHRCQAGRKVLLGVDHLQADGQALCLAQVQCGNFHGATLPRQQGDDPAGGGLGVTVQRIEAVDLAGALHVELRFQRRQVGFAELGYVLGFQGQFDRFTGIEPCAIDIGDQLCCCDLQDGQQAE
ncbi:hypothetical protein D3C80_966140 [compost metagenome]